MKISEDYAYIDRMGNKIYVEKIEHHTHPFLGSNGITYNEEGFAHDKWNISAWDLVVLADEETCDVDLVNHPPHYTNHPSGVECIEITRHMGFNLGNAIKYIWRADLKGDSIQDLKKAIFYLNDEINKRENNPKN